MNKPGKCELSDTVVNSKNKNKSLASYLWNTALRFTNNRECGAALEAADTLLGIPLYKTDPITTVRWLDVNQIRYRKVKSYKEIEALNKNSTDIFYPFLIDNHYHVDRKN